MADQDSENTSKKSTKVAVELFRRYLADKGKSEDFLHCLESDLNDIFKQFYAEARKMVRPSTANRRYCQIPPK